MTKNRSSKNDPSHPLLTEELLLRIAKLTHFHYLAKSAGERIEWDDPVAADTAWENLREEDRQQNLSQARSIPKKLELVGLEVADKSYDQRIRLTQAEIEILAADEHQRWMAVKANQGYRYGKTRSDIPPRRHPDLRSYESLEDKTKEFDRRIARMLPTWLHRVGLGVRRRHP